MFFLTPKYLKQGGLYLKEAKKRLAYHRDQWNEQTVRAFEEVIKDFKTSLKARNRDKVKEAEATLEGLCARHCPIGKDAWISENVEVFLVAIIVALGIRTYFLQPFTIPTSSMYPTLCGVIGHKTTEEPPNALVQAWQFALYGRTWHNVVAESDEVITSIHEQTRGGWRRIFTYTEIDTAILNPDGTRSPDGHVYFVNEMSAPIEKEWGVHPDQTFHAGQPIVRGYTTTGDHVFVDKMSYHFRAPKRGEVFVFDTSHIPEMRNGSLPGPFGAPPLPPSQFYIKRLAGLPGDTLQIQPPQVYINDKVPADFAFQRVMKGTFEHPVDDYRGYSNDIGFPGGRPFERLGHVSETFTVPPKHFFAMGDNSYDSADSRDWGPVPEGNLIGPGLFVYWPFLREPHVHFGLIK